jgi:hypothetical protein
MGMGQGHFPSNHFHGRRRNVACTAAHRMGDFPASPKVSWLDLLERGLTVSILGTAPDFPT